MTDSIVAAAAALVGVALGAYLQGLSARRLFAAQQRADHFERERHIVRELFEVLAEHRRAYELTIANSAGVLRGLAPDAMGTAKIPWERLKMLVGLYAPELAAPVASFDKFAPVLMSHMVRARSGAHLPEGEKQALLVSLSTDLEKLGATYDEMERALLARAEDLRRVVRASAGLSEDPAGAREA